GLVPGAGADLQDALARLDVQRLAHEPHDVRLADGLAVADGERLVRGGVPALRRRHELAAVERGDGLQHSPVGDASPGQLPGQVRVAHTPSVRRRRAGRSRAQTLPTRRLCGAPGFGLMRPPAMPTPPEDPSALIARLQRATDALASPAPPTPLAPLVPPGAPAALRGAASGGMGLAVAFVAIAIATGRYGLIVPAIIIGVAAGLLRLLRATREMVTDPTRAEVGMGAEIGEGARLEPGSRVGAGATVGKGAHLEPGAVVGMGAGVATAW